MPKRVAILVDGGWLRALARVAKRPWTPDYVEKFLVQKFILPSEDEQLLRILYYDCPPFEGTTKRPFSGEETTFSREDSMLPALGQRDYFAVRRGTLKLRGWRRRSGREKEAARGDEDFEPDFQQKGVDLRIGLDVASLSYEKLVERIVLVAGDTDLIPAMKLARKSGIQIVLADLPGARLTRELVEHSDFRRRIDWLPGKG